MKKSFAALVIIMLIFSLSIFTSCANGKNVKAVCEAIDALPDAEIVAIYDGEQINAAWDKYNALSASEKKKVTNYDKLEGCKSALDSLERISACRNAISDLPSEATVVEADRETIETARKMYDALSEVEKTKITNYQVLVRLEEAINSSGWVESSKFFYIDSATSADLTFAMRLNGGISSFTCNGAELSKIDYSFDGGQFKISGGALDKLESESFNKFVITDGNGEKFGFIVCKGIVENQLVYFDFDTVSYTNGDPASVKNSVVDNGIDGKSLRFRQNSTTNNLFIGFYREGNFGFPKFNFVHGRTYQFEFLIKDNGLDPEYCLNMPISFKSGFDIGYIRNNADGLYLSLPEESGLDNLTASLIKEENSSSTYRFSCLFTVTDESVCSDLQISCWKKDGTPADVLGSIDILMDEILLVAKSDVFTVKTYIDNLPEKVSVKDKKAVYAVYDLYNSLTEKQKSELSVSGVSKLKKFREQIFNAEVEKVQSEIDSVLALGEENITETLYSTVSNILKKLNSLEEFERAAVFRTDELVSLKMRISDMRVKRVIKEISALDNSDNAYADVEKLINLSNLRTYYDFLEDKEKDRIENAEKLLNLADICLPEWTITGIITSPENSDVNIKFDVKYATIRRLTVFSQQIDELYYVYKNGTLTIAKEYFSGSGKGTYPIDIALNTGERHIATILYGFDEATDNYIDYDNRVNKREQGEIAENGLSGASLHYKYDSFGDDTIIGFHYSDDYFGFAKNSFEENSRYEITFNLKVLSEHTDEDNPCCFEVRYAFDSLLNVNYYDGKYVASEKFVEVDYVLTENADGSITVRLIYTCANANDFIQFSTHNMPVDLLLDNITVMKIS